MASTDRKNVHDQLDDLMQEIGDNNGNIDEFQDNDDNYDSQNVNQQQKAKKKRKRNKKKKKQGDENGNNQDLQSARLMKDQIALDQTPLKYKLGASL